MRMRLDHPYTLSLPYDGLRSLHSTHYFFIFRLNDLLSSIFEGNLFNIRAISEKVNGSETNKVSVYERRKNPNLIKLLSPALEGLGSSKI